MFLSIRIICGHAFDQHQSVLKNCFHPRWIWSNVIVEIISNFIVIAFPIINKILRITNVLSEPTKIFRVDKMIFLLSHKVWMIQPGITVDWEIQLHKPLSLTSTLIPGNMLPTLCWLSINISLSWRLLPMSSIFDLLLDWICSLLGSSEPEIANVQSAGGSYIKPQ